MVTQGVYRFSDKTEWAKDRRERRKSRSKEYNGDGDTLDISFGELPKILIIHS